MSQGKYGILRSEDADACKLTVISSEATKPAKRLNALAAKGRSRLLMLASVNPYEDVIQLGQTADDGKSEDKVLCLCGELLEEAYIHKANREKDESDDGEEKDSDPMDEETAVNCTMDVKVHCTECGSQMERLKSKDSLYCDFCNKRKHCAPDAENFQCVECARNWINMCDGCYVIRARAEQSAANAKDGTTVKEECVAGEEKDAAGRLQFGSHISSNLLCDCGSKYERSAAVGKCELCRKVKSEQMLVCRKAMHKAVISLCADCVELKKSVANASAALRQMHVQQKGRYGDAVPIPCHSCARDTRAGTAWKCCNLRPETYAANDAFIHYVFCEDCFKQLRVLSQDVSDERKRKKHSDVVWVPKSTRMQDSERDWFWPNASLWRMVYPSKEKPIDMRSLKLVWCEFKPESDSSKAERLAYIQVKVNDILVEEQLEAAKAKCGISLSVTLYWLFSKEDYGNYGAGDYEPSFIPEVAFCGSKLTAEMEDDSESVAKRHFSAISMHEFFGIDAHSRMLEMARNKRNVCPNLHLKRVVLYCMTRKLKGEEITSSNPRLKDVCVVDETRQIFQLRSAKYTKCADDSQYAEGTEDSKDTDAIADMYPLTFRVHTLQRPGIEDSGVVLEYIPLESDSSPPWTWFKDSKKLLLTLSNAGVLCLDEANPTMENQVFRLWHRSEGIVAMSCISADRHYVICRGDRTERGNVVKTELVSSVLLDERIEGAHFCLQVVDDDANTLRLPLHETQGFGLLNCYSVKMETEITEPLELESYPFDFQDIPVRIRALNFDKLLPAFYGHSEDGDWIANGKKRFFVLTTGDAVDCGSLTIVNTVTEFVYNSKEKDELRILFKARRNYGQILPTCFLMVALAALNLTVFAIETDEIADRLAHVFALLLALMFIDFQKTPVFTFMDMLFYAMFGLSIAVAVQCSFADKLPGNQSSLSFFGVAFVVTLVWFSLRARFMYLTELDKLWMDSVEIERSVSLQSKALVQGTKCTDGSVQKRGENEAVLLYQSVFKAEVLFSGIRHAEEKRLPDTTRMALLWLFHAFWIDCPVLIMGIAVAHSCQCAGKYVAEMWLLFALTLARVPFDLYNSSQFCVDNAFALMWLVMASVFVHWVIAIHLTLDLSKGHYECCRVPLNILYNLFVAWDVFYAALTSVLLRWVVCRMQPKFELIFTRLLFSSVEIVGNHLLPFVSVFVALLAFDSGNGCHSRKSTFGYAEVVSMLALIILFTASFPAFHSELYNGTLTIVASLVYLTLFGLHCHALSFWVDTDTQCSNALWRKWNLALNLLVICTQLIWTIWSAVHIRVERYFVPRRRPKLYSPF